MILQHSMYRSICCEECSRIVVLQTGCIHTLSSSMLRSKQTYKGACLCQLSEAIEAGNVELVRELADKDPVVLLDVNTQLPSGEFIWSKRFLCLPPEHLLSCCSAQHKNYLTPVHPFIPEFLG